MSADVMRRAAAKARARADAATDGPWRTYSQPAAIVFDQYGLGVRSDASHDVVSYAGQVYSRDAEHIASWDPTTARAVADLLDAGADEVERRVARDGEGILDRANPVFHAMAELARTYLRESA